MKLKAVYLLLAVLSANVNSETVTRCVRNGNELNCESSSREEANTPPSYNKLGNGEWCLVSNGQIKKYHCSYNSYQHCIGFAEADNIIARGKVSSCVKNQ